MYVELLALKAWRRLFAVIHILHDLFIITSNEETLFQYFL